MISTLIPGETLLRTWLDISVALENSPVRLVHSLAPDVTLNTGRNHKLTQGRGDSFNVNKRIKHTLSLSFSGCDPRGEVTGDHRRGHTRGQTRSNRSQKTEGIQRKRE
ncbi:uncharacterized protein LOC123513586 [Portunus trituberculatus]|uniref:uncharacterized protein LOC123513586 n=1 Tax=Portunus trituberculatus TaxID=210409 RepID=UPI001E1D0438|nr:uncharacterized protein LOC123513586 [Portunus trituberculatus]